MKGNPIKSNLLAFLAGLLAIFLLLETGLRISGFNPFGEFFEAGGRAVFLQPSANPQRIFEAVPGAEGSGWGTEISINGLGFRGRDYSLEKPAGVKRVAVIGDSITFGNNLPLEQNFSSLLEQRYSSSDDKVEVLNLGLGGYDTLQEVATLEDLGLPMEPDHVVLAFCINDIGIASGNLNYIKRLQKYGNSPLYRSRLAQLVRVQFDRIEAARELEQGNRKETFRETYEGQIADLAGDQKLLQLMQKLKRGINHEKQNYYLPAYSSPIKVGRLRYAFEQLAQLSKQKQLPVTVVLFPWLLEDDQTRPLYKLVYELVSHEASRQGFNVIDLYPVYRERGFENLVLREGDGIHPNHVGHQLAADAIFQAIGW
jgi:lysophospholipase L1-like esterase